MENTNKYTDLQNIIVNNLIPYWQNSQFEVQLVYISGSRLNQTYTELSDYDVVFVGTGEIPKYHGQIHCNERAYSCFFHNSVYYITNQPAPQSYTSGLIDALHLKDYVHSNILYINPTFHLDSFLNQLECNTPFIIHDYLNRYKKDVDLFIRKGRFKKELYHQIDALFLQYHYNNPQLLKQLKYQHNLDLLLKLLMCL